MAEFNYIGSAFTWNSTSLAAETVTAEVNDETDMLQIQPAVQKRDRYLDGRERASFEVVLFVNDTVMTAIATNAATFELVDGQTGQKYTGSGVIQSKQRSLNADGVLQVTVSGVVSGTLTREAVV